MWLVALLSALPPTVDTSNACFRDPPPHVEHTPQAVEQRAPDADTNQTPTPEPSLMSPTTTTVSEEAARAAADEKRRLELSFSSAEKFYNQSVYDPTGFVARRTIPVSTLRPTGEWLFAQDASLFFAFDLPLEPRVELRDAKLVETYVSPALLTGLRANVFSVFVLNETKLELQVEGSLGWLLAPNEEARLFPGAGWRLHLRDLNGFTLFAGLSFEFRLNVAALIYGVGHRF